MQNFLKLYIKGLLEILMNNVRYLKIDFLGHAKSPSSFRLVQYQCSDSTEGNV